MKGLVSIAAVVVVLLGSVVQGQPVFQSASGCKEAGIVTTEQALNPGTGGFSQDRTIIPGEDTTVVLGAWLIAAYYTLDPTAGVTPNCAASPDTHPLYVVQLALRPVSGDPIRAGVKTVTFWQDNDFDGQFTSGRDTQFSSPMPGSCLAASEGCILSFGNSPIFGGLGGLLDPPAGFCIPSLPLGGGGCAALLAVADIASPQGGATLQVRLEGKAANLVNNPVDPIGSDFSPSFSKTASSIRVRVEGAPSGGGGTPPPGGGTSGGAVLSPSVNNGNGSSETGVQGLNVTGIRTRDDRGGLTGTAARDARPGDREYFVGIVALCEGGQAVTREVGILPAVAGASPTIAGGLGAIPCVPNAVTDGFPTNLVRVRVGVSGPGAQYIQAVHLYGDVDLDGSLFEANELMLSGVPVNGIIALGSLEQILVFPNGVLASLGDATPFPALLYVTADISDTAQASSVRLQVAVDIAALTGFPSSRLMNTTPAEWTFQITGSGGGMPPPPPPPSGGGTLRSYDTNNNNIIDDPEFFNIIDAWIAGQLNDQVFFQAVDIWVSQSSIGSAGIDLKPLTLGAVTTASARGMIDFAVRGQGIESMAVQVYQLDGQRVFAQESPGTRLRWYLDTAEGQLVANGIYLYVVTARGANGEFVRSEIKKLVVLR